jgi:hypothetical protein
MEAVERDEWLRTAWTIEVLWEEEIDRKNETVTSLPDCATVRVENVH